MRSGGKITVLIVDDSFFMRRFLREILSKDPGIEIVGEAKDGSESVGEALRLAPDVITMDYNLPKMNGAEAVSLILKKSASPPAIIMVSAYTMEGAEATLESLRAGAVDFIAKPSGELSFDIDKIGAELLIKIRAAVGARITVLKSLPTKPSVKVRQLPDGHAKAIVIGASTGGPPILEEFFMSRHLGEAKAFFLIVQHMPPYFTRTFADRLNRTSSFQIKEAEDGDLIKRGMGFVAPGDFHMKVSTGKDDEPIIKLTRSAPRHGLRPAIDITMSSAAENFGRGTIGVILTGMGKDGLEGMRSIKLSGGYTLVQDPATATIDSMPRAVIENNLADEILPPTGLIERIINLAL